MNATLRIVILCAIFLGSLTPAQSDYPAEYRPLEPGLDYRHEKTDAPHSIHVLRIDRGRKHWHWTTGQGQGRVLGLGAVASIVQATARHGRPVAAINGDWFEIVPGNYQGDPRGLQILDGEIVSAPAAYSCFWVDRDGNPRIDQIISDLRIIWPDGKSETPIGLNERRADDRAVLYTPTLVLGRDEAGRSRPSTRTTTGRELALERNGDSPWLPLLAGKTYPAKIARIRDGGDTPLDEKTVILSLGPKLVEKLPRVEVGAVVTIKLDTTPSVEGARTAIGGGPRLMKAGKKQPQDASDKPRHPRSMVGYNATHYFLVVVDGRQPKLSIGMTYTEMCGLAERLGCTEAMALDGGGSSTLWADKRILNSPSGGAPRAVANALILVETKR